MSIPDDRSPLYPAERITPLPNEAELMRRSRQFTRSRRITGAILGLVLGAVYITILLTVNSIVLPDIPLYIPPPGVAWSALIGAAAGLLIGLTASWSNSAPLGIFLGSLIGAILLNGFNLYQNTGPATTLAGFIAILFVIFPTVTAFISLILIIFRYLLDRQQAAVQDQRAIYLQVGIPVILVLVISFFAWSQQYPPSAQVVIGRMQNLIATGLRSPDEASLPPELTPEKIDGFRDNAIYEYTLQWDRDPYNRFQIGRPGNTEGRESLVIARFKNGWMLVCLYPQPNWEPRCKGLWQSVAP